MAILAPHLSSALDRSAIFLTDLAGRTVKNCHSLRGPRFEPRRLPTKLHGSIEYPILFLKLLDSLRNCFIMRMKSYLFNSFSKQIGAELFGERHID